MNERFYPPEEVIAVPDVEVARYLARESRLDMALSHTQIADGRGGRGESDQAVWYVREAVKKGMEPRDSTFYEESVIYELQLTTPSEAVRKVAGAVLERTNSDTLLTTLLYDGLERFGGVLRKTNEGQVITPTVEAVAALAFHKVARTSGSLRTLSSQAGADGARLDTVVRFEDPVEQSFYDQYDSINEQGRAIVKAVGEAEYHMPSGNRISVFRTPNQTDNSSRTDWWWNRLAIDVDLMNRA